MAVSGLGPRRLIMPVVPGGEPAASLLIKANEEGDFHRHQEYGDTDYRWGRDPILRIAGRPGSEAGGVTMRTGPTTARDEGECEG